ncbi:mediator of DNA damage checkpoint protein 1-like isoform X2 [Stylophora pistillata]|uniref:mediator of DNA damage checkpoint protein 1-like isoform X2 n=1 Tax=Stylophora pistillata TaxID=50429 RepID=UPI000C041E37|nr:mediator of DNA damage checkpoint protein 1-like isoform X2 [Stylophora pistillata]
MDFDQTQVIDDFGVEEEVSEEENNGRSKKIEVAHLKVFSQQGFKESVFPVFKGDNFIGRDGKCNITIPIKALSKKHACIEVQRDLHLLYDCKSKNRTRKGKSLLKPMVRYELKHGDMLTFGDVTCQYLVGMEEEEEDGDETGSETGSESMLMDVNVDEELKKTDKSIVSEDVSLSSTIDEHVKGAIPRESLLQATPGHKTKKPSKDDEDAYAADTDSDTDEERPLVTTAVPTIMFSSEDEKEIPNDQRASSELLSVPIKQDTSMEGQTLAFGLGSPTNVFLSRDSTGSSGSHSAQTGSIPPTLKISSESDSLSDVSPFRHPGARGSVTQPPCGPTLLYGSESDDGSPIKRPRHPTVRVADKGPSCEPTLLYGSESDGSPKKKPRLPMASNEPTLLYESDSDESNDKAAKRLRALGDSHQGNQDQTLLYSDISEGKLPSIPGKSSADGENKDSTDGSTKERPNTEEEMGVVEDTDATLPYCRAEMSSTDDEGESGVRTAKRTSVDETPAPILRTLACNTKEIEEDLTDDEQHNRDADDYGADVATQAYAVQSDSELEIESVSTRDEAVARDLNQVANPSDLEATQAYCIEEGEDSDSSDSQPLPIGIAKTAATDDIQATLAYGIGEPERVSDSERVDNNDGDHKRGQAQALVYDDLQATLAYVIGGGDDEEGCTETDGEQPSDLDAGVSRGDDVQATTAYGLEATQAYGAEEIDEEETAVKNRDDIGGYQGRGTGPDANAATLAYDFGSTQPYCGNDNGATEDDKGDNAFEEHITKMENLATLAYGLEETQAYAFDNNDSESSHNDMIEATQAYGIDGPSAEETGPLAQLYAASTVQGGVTGIDENKNGVSAVSEVDISKPSSSSAVDVVDDSQDREDVMPRRSRSTRGRKKPVIEDSQEVGSAENYAVSVVEISNNDKREETKVESTPGSILNRNGKNSRVTLSSRKGRRGAMRVTIDSGMPDEDEGKETLSRGGQSGTKETNASESQDKETSKVPASTGRKRRRQAGKGKFIEEMEGTTIRKSRRGQKGKGAQMEATFLPETPPMPSTDTTAKEIRESPPDSSAEAVPTRGKGKGRGKGRGRKNEQLVEESVARESIGSEISTISNEPEPPETVSTPARGKGRGKGRGIKAQPKIGMDHELEASASTSPQKTSESIGSEISTISSEPEPPETVSTPARGKGRGKGRGIKAQPKIGMDHESGASANTSPQTETPTVNVNELQPSESPASVSTSKRKSRGRKRIQPTAAESEALVSSEGTEYSETIADSEESSTAGSSQQSCRVRPRKQQPEDSESVEMVETPAKRGRRGKEPSVNRSPSLQRGRSSTENSPRIIFTGLYDKQGEKVVISLGGQLVDNIHNCTHLVTDKVRRTVKFLCGLAGGQIIVLPSWLEACKKAKSFVDTSPFLVKDKDAEKQYNFDLQRSHEVALTKGLLEGYKVHVTKKVKPEPSQMKDIIQSAKGEFLTSMPRSKEDRVFVISCNDDRSVCRKPMEAGIPVVSAEVLLTGVLQQELNLEEYKLFAEEMSDTTQETSSLSGQNKRRNETSEGGGATSSSSTPGAKNSGSKRRKR